MNKRALYSFIVAAVVAIATAAQAATRTWDNDSGDGKWQTDANWSGDTKPATSDTVIVNNGDTVDVNIGDSFPYSLNITVAGNSTLAASSVLRLNNATIMVESGSGLTSISGAFWDLANGDLTFEDGAICTIDDWEQKGVNTFTFEMGASGFTTLAPNNFKIGGGATIADATYTVDMKDYTGGAGTITLVDFGADAVGMNNATFQGAGGLIVTNNEAYPYSSVMWNDAMEAIQLFVGIDPPFKWDGGGSDDSWTTAENWTYDVMPNAGSDVLVSSGASVTNGQNQYTTLTVESGASVLFGVDGAATIISSGMIGRTGGAWRLGEASNITLTETGSFGGGFTHLDLRGADLNFYDGASCASRFNFEHRFENTFGFTLSETGFTALVMGGLMGGDSDFSTPGSQPCTWADVTYNIDISDYDRSNGKSIVLMDFNNSWLGGTFDPSANSPTVNVTGHDGGTLVWDAVNKDLILEVVVPITGTVILVY
ncbi:MAG: hypothetical protein PF904_16375 [Kiritimatiellae bacterium]|jgi:hypothetical protein|nr:hypothetical protein [Kiritimatiellia bacterium]